MLSLFLKRPIVSTLRGGAMQHVLLSRPSAAFSSVATNVEAPPPPEAEPVEGITTSLTVPSVKVFKRDITQSPKKVRFLLKLVCCADCGNAVVVVMSNTLLQVRNAWVPDALAQMKFSPKHKAVDVAALIQVR